MKDNLIKCPLTGEEFGCYVTPINETMYSYNSLVNGFASCDLWKVGEWDFEKMEEKLPKLYVDLKIIDDSGKVWYPNPINNEEKGVVFVNGKSSEDWGWCAIKNVIVSEDEKEKFKKPDGGYFEFKSDPKTFKNFGKEGYIDALDYVGLI